MTIWKFKLKLEEVQTISLPKYSHKLTVQMQNGIPCLWVAVDEKEELDEVKIYTIGTGQEIPDNLLEYLGTYQQSLYVWHVFSESNQ